jgi:ankyrin repeat protein
MEDKIWDELYLAFENHSVEGIKKCFAQGISPNEHRDNNPIFYEFLSYYMRSPQFKECVKVFVDGGLDFEDKIFLSVLLNDHKKLEFLLENDLSLINKRYSFRSSFIPMEQVSLLHICAEFNHVDCAQVLTGKGADINATAGVDEYGFGGQTPVFHCVNQNMNQSKEMLDFLLAHDADLMFTVKGLVWGKSYEWETLLPAVNPISFAMMGLLPQMHRNEITTSHIVIKLLKAAYGIDYVPANVPNKYLRM